MIYEINKEALKERIENRVVNILLIMGMSPNLNGYNYLKEGIKSAVTDPKNMSNLSKLLYPKIANKYNTTISRVERGIRHALENAYNKGRIFRLNNEFNLAIFEKYEKPTNAEFMAIVADKIALEVGMYR